MVQLTTEHLTYEYPGADEPALHDVSITISTGEFVALIGANNCGKSTLCYALAGVVPQLYHGKMQGKIVIDGVDIRDTSVGEIALNVGLVLQVPGSQISGVRYTVFEEVAFGLENRGVAREEMQQRVRKTLHLMGLEAYAQHSPFHLSGGQQQRLALATVLATEPSVLILDEPTTFLDPQGATLVFDILRQLQQQGKTIIIAEQKMDLIAEYADRVLAFDEGNLVMDGTPREVLTSPIMQRIHLNWTRYSQVADLACKNGLIPADQPLPASLSETVEVIDRLSPVRENHVHSC
ncbi:energy-coupling factor ABC transporter ATP-binding protein [Desulforhopalus sp. 52FAK]